MLYGMTSGRSKNPEAEGGVSGALSSTPSRIVGTGEMAARVRGYDWSSTPLGPIESWSKELLTIVNLVLASPLPARTMWGQEFILIYNDGYRSFPGPRHPAALGKPAREIYRESWSVVGPLLEKSFATGETVFHEKLLVPLPTEHGVRHVYLNYFFNPIFEDGKIAGLFGPLHDVTGEVLATERLRESEARLARILNSIGDAVIVTDGEARVTQMNPVAEELTGWTTEQAEGRPLDEVFAIVDETSRQRSESPADKVRRFGTVVGLSGQTLLIRKDGSEVPIDDSGAPIRDDDGKLTGIVLVFRDVRELKRSEAALLQSEKLAAVGRLASSIAHEINNPLEAVMNLIYLARQHAIAPDAQRYLDAADAEIRRVSIIANQTLRFHKQPSNPEAVSCADLYSSVLGVYEGKLRNSNIEVEQRFRTEQTVVCYQGDIRQVLGNLVGNAIDATQRGGRLLMRSRMGTEWSTGRRGLVLTVADSGAGIPCEALGQIFEAFFTTKGIGGTGLGLWVSREIVARHRGSLRVRSTQRAGRSGTAFALFLPFEAALGEG
jgi:PAS domain S-box-containing protein